MLVIPVMFVSNLFGQTSITLHSSNGYDVKITIISADLYNKRNYQNNNSFQYNVKIVYKVEITGSNAPGSLYNLQGYMHCSEDTYFALSNSSGTGTVISANASYNGPNASSITFADICKSIDFVVSGPGINGKFNLPLGGQPLPIELTSFDVVQNKNQIDIAWETASERNNDFFTIEKTTDGVNYEWVGTVKGAGNATTKRHYEFTDQQAVSGLSYYRLTQTDFDGKSESFDVKSVDFKQNMNQVNVYPNPTNDYKVKIFIPQTNDLVEMRIVNLYGQIVATKNVNASMANVLETVDLPHQGNLFFVELIQNNSLVARQKVIALN